MIFVIAACSGSGNDTGNGNNTPAPPAESGGGDNTPDIQKPPTDSGGRGGDNTPAPPTDSGGGDNTPDTQKPPTDNGGSGGDTNTPVPPTDSGESGGDSAAGLSGTAGEVLGKLVADMTATGVELPMLPPPMDVAADVSQNSIGLSEADFERLVVSASSATPMIMTFAHQFAVIQAKDAKSAAEVKKIISGDGGYNPGKWICVHPDVVAAVESGDYVLLAASSADAVDAIVEAFEATAGSIGDVNVFYEFAG